MANLNRAEIMQFLKVLPEAERVQLAERMGSCTVRAVMQDGTVVLRNEIRSGGSALYQMFNDENIAYFEYCFNNKWYTAV